MSVPNVSALAAALFAKLTPDPSIILEGLDPVPLPSDRSPRAEDAKAADDPKPAQKPSPLPAAQAVEAARQTAAGRQSGIAPLMADLEAAIRNESLPAPVKAAAAKVLALQTLIDAKVTPETIKRAVTQSGLFLEPRLAQSRAAPPPDLKTALLVLRQVLRAAAPAPATPAAALSAPPPAAQPAAPQPLASQSGTTPQSPILDAADIPAPGSPPAPTGLARTYAPPAASLLPRVEPQMTAPAAAAPNLPALPAAPATTPGATAPAAFAPPTVPGQPAPPPQFAALQPPVPSPFPAAAPLPFDRAATPAQPQTTFAGTPQTAPAAAQPLPNAPFPERPVLQAPVAALPLPAAPEAGEAPAPAQPQPSPRAAAERPVHTAPEETPAPPVKGAPPQAQKAAQAHLPESADPAALLRHLERGASGAIARTELFQLASLPDAPRADGEQRPVQSWLFEVPLATQQGPAIAQFEIEKDGSNGQVGREGAAWRTRFSVDVEPLGLIHALLVLAGGKTTVTLWAERAESLKRLRQDQADLAGSLEAEVAVYPGRPTAPKPTPGRFLDASS